MENLVLSVVGSAYLGLLVVALGWFLKKSIGKIVDEAFENKAMLFEKVLSKRIEVAEIAFDFTRKFVAGIIPIRQGLLLSAEIEAKLICWFPDEVVVKYQEFIARMWEDPSGSGIEWTKDVEPVLHAIVSSLKTHSYKKKAFKLEGKDLWYLPTPKFVEAEQDDQVERQEGHSKEANLA